MSIKMVREPSDTPNINNIDDIIPMRYAYGGQNGYVIGKGTEISNTVNGSNFVINSGRLVLQGVECDIDASGVTIAVDNIATKRYYIVYLQVNLATNKVSIESTYDTADYPTIDSGDDLTQNSSGIAKMVLYKFTAINGIISEVNKVVESIKYTKDIDIENAKAVNNLSFYKDNDFVKLNNVIMAQEILLYKNTNPTYLREQTINFINNLTLKKGDTFKIKHSADNNYGFKANEFSISENISASYYELFHLTASRIYGTADEVSTKAVYNWSTDIHVYSDRIVVQPCILAVVNVPKSGNVTTAFMSSNGVAILDIYKIIE